LSSLCSVEFAGLGCLEHQPMLEHVVVQRLSHRISVLRVLPDELDRLRGECGQDADVVPLLHGSSQHDCPEDGVDFIDLIDVELIVLSHN